MSCNVRLVWSVTLDFISALWETRLNWIEAKGKFTIRLLHWLAIWAALLREVPRLTIPYMHDRFIVIFNALPSIHCVCKLNGNIPHYPFSFYICTVSFVRGASTTETYFNWPFSCHTEYDPFCIGMIPWQTNDKNLRTSRERYRILERLGIMQLDLNFSNKLL